jgi:hypothetical protein
MSNLQGTDLGEIEQTLQTKKGASKEAVPCFRLLHRLHGLSPFLAHTAGKQEAPEFVRRERRKREGTQGLGNYVMNIIIGLLV